MIRKVEDNCINIENLDQEIYRVFSYGRFEQLINDQELVLVKPSNDFDETRGSNGLYRVPFNTDLLLDEICMYRVTHSGKTSE
ncbi:hypothetical protein BCU26_024295 [Vibrio splendidus]|uniref:hypothetical protein n=1 Tax=Vibrio splendidus TaxID=29497 RepID=UPI0039A5DE5C